MMLYNDKKIVTAIIGTAAFIFLWHGGWAFIDHMHQKMQVADKPLVSSLGTITCGLLLLLLDRENLSVLFS